MKDFNVVKVDSKGRIIVPYHIRDYLGLDEGTELIVTNYEQKELRIFPLLKGTASIDVLMTDAPGSLAKLLDAVSRNKAEILMSISKTIERGKLAEWNAILDISKSKRKKLENEIKKLSVVKKVHIEEK